MDELSGNLPNTAGKKIALAVVNDLNYDQRMQRICTALANGGFAPTLFGRLMPESKPLTPKDFTQKRFKHPIQKGKLFYVWHNIRLFIAYLFNHFDIYVANDLDTMPAAWLAAKLKGKPLVYDAHEYFPELPEIVKRPLVMKTWLFLEKMTVPKLKYAYTINQSYADIFDKKYGVKFGIVRNATVLTQKEFLPPKEKFILYQGAVNVGRGVEEMIKAMPHLDCKLVICGKGDVFDECVKLSKQLHVEHKVEFRGFVAPKELIKITQKASLGFTFFTKEGQSYYYSLANRFFDYFHNGVPQLCVDYPEYRLINDQFNIALLLPNLNTETIVKAAKKILDDEAFYQKIKNNCLEARQQINWQNEERTLLNIYNNIP